MGKSVRMLIHPLLDYAIWTSAGGLGILIISRDEFTSETACGGCPPLRTSKLIIYIRYGWISHFMESFLLEEKTVNFISVFLPFLRIIKITYYAPLCNMHRERDLVHLLLYWRPCYTSCCFIPYFFPSFSLNINFVFSFYHHFFHFLLYFMMCVCFFYHKPLFSSLLLSLLKEKQHDGWKSELRQMLMIDDFDSVFFMFYFVFLHVPFIK